jgi:hypothetical protein
MIINTNENKVVSIILYVPHEKWRIEKEYASGDVVWYDGAYYEYKAATAATTGFVPTDTAKWDALTGRKRFDTANIIGLTIELFYKGSREAIKGYSLVIPAPNPDGWLTIDDTDSANSVYSIQILKSYITKKKEGIILADIRVVEDTPGIGDDGKTYTTINDVFIAQLNIPYSEFKTVPLP